MDSQNNMSNVKIGWIGLGKMGMPMSSQFLKAGYTVYAYCRNQVEKEMMTAKGAHIAESYLQLIESVDVLFLMVPDDEAIAQIFQVASGILTGDLIGKTIVNMSTVSPGINRLVAKQCASKGVHFLDAPVSGSIKQAEEAKLVIMAGGEQKVFETIKPLFDILSTKSSLIGATGSGNVAKIAVNILLGIEAQGLAEAINFAECNGVSPKEIMPVINEGVLGSLFIRLKSELIINENFSPAFALLQIAKDLRLAKAEGLDSPLGNAVYETFQQAETLFGKEDIIAVKKHLKSLIKTI